MTDGRVVFKALSWLLPFCLALFHTSPDSYFRVGERQGLLPRELRLSTLLGEACQLLPLGDHALRERVCGAFFVGLAGWLLYELACLLLKLTAPPAHPPASQEPTSHVGLLGELLAISASVAASTSLSWVGEAAMNPRSTAAASLALLAAYALFGRKLLLLALALVLLLLEVPPLAALLATSLLLFAPRTLLPQLGAAAATQKSFSLRNPLTWLVLYLALALGLSWAQPLPTGAQQAPLAWASQLGLLWTLSAGFCLVWLFTTRTLVPLALLLSALIALDLALPLAPELLYPAALGQESARASLHLLALAALAPLGAVGLKSASEMLKKGGAFFLRPLLALLLLLAATSSVAGAEDTHRRLLGMSSLPSTRFARLALLDLPPRAVVLAKNSLVAQKLARAQKDGLRPDVLLLLVERLNDAAELTSLLEKEPALATLIREYSVRGGPSEEAMDLLAQVRPIYLTPDSSWDPLLLEHLLPAVPLALFSKHAVGRSDRALALDAALPAAQVLLEEDASDLATLSLTTATVEELAASMERIGDRGAAARLREFLEVARITASDPKSNESDE